MVLPATLDISLDFSSGATFGIGLTLDDPVNGLLDTGILSESTTPSLIADLTPDARRISIRRGRNLIRDTYEAGNATVRIYDPNGRPKGSKNRSTIARHWLQVNQNLKNPLTGENETMSQEDLMTLALIKKAREGDVNAYKALMDSGYGAPVQQIEQTNTDIDLSGLTTDELKELLKGDDE